MKKFLNVAILPEYHRVSLFLFQGNCFSSFASYFESSIHSFLENLEIEVDQALSFEIVLLDDGNEGKIAVQLFHEEHLVDLQVDYGLGSEIIAVFGRLVGAGDPRRRELKGFR